MSGLHNVRATLAGLNVVEAQRQNIGTDNSAFVAGKDRASRLAVEACGMKAHPRSERVHSGYHCESGDLVAGLQDHCQMASRIQGYCGCSRHSAGASRRISCGAFDLVSCQYRVIVLLLIFFTLQTAGLGTKLGGRQGGHSVDKNIMPSACGETGNGYRVRDRSNHGITV